MGSGAGTGEEGGEGVEAVRLLARAFVFGPAGWCSFEDGADVEGSKPDPSRLTLKLILRRAKSVTEKPGRTSGGILEKP